MNINLLVKIAAKAWSLPILVAFENGTPGRQAPLLAATGAGRSSFLMSLEHLIELRLIERNPGYGHPLRPEFRLTEEGKAASVLASQIYALDVQADPVLLRRSWTLPVLATMQTPKSFGSIKANLERITDRALSQSLKSLEAIGWVVREVEANEWPPRPLYDAVGVGGALRDVLAAEVTLQIGP